MLAELADLLSHIVFMQGRFFIISFYADDWRNAWAQLCSSLTTKFSPNLEP